MRIYGLGDGVELQADDVAHNPNEVSYLGWNIRGLVADIVGLPKGMKK